MADQSDHKLFMLLPLARGVLVLAGKPPLPSAVPRSRAAGLQFLTVPVSLIHRAVRPLVFMLLGAEGLHVQIRDGSGSSKAKTARKRKEPRNQGTLFNFSGEGGRLDSGRTHQGFVTIDTEQVTTHSAPIARPAHRDNRSVPASKPRSHGLRPAVPKERILQEHWEGGPDETEPRPRLHREGGGDLVIHSRRVTLDFDVLLLPAGMTFGNDSCLGRGWLHELIALLTAERDEHCPAPHSFLTFDLHPSISAQEFELNLEKAVQHVRDIFSQRDYPSPEENGAWQSFLHSMVQHLSWLLARAPVEEYISLCASLQKHLAQLQDIVDQPREVLPEDDKPSVLELEIRWFTLEAMTRLECHRTRRQGVVEGSAVRQHTQRLVMRLWSIGFQELLTPFKNDISDPPINNVPFAKRAAELWVSLIHYIEAWTSAQDPQLDESDRLVSLWHVLHRLASQEGLLRTSASEVASCESVWRCVFTLCALSQFSVHGTSLSSPRGPASWQFIELALDRVKLTANPALEAPLSKRSLQKRDEYIRIQLARCLILARKWKWPLGDAINLVNRLLEIFKSRNFANMTDEYPEFPSFLRHNNIHLLDENKRSDTAFTLFLKLVVKAVNDTRPPAQGNNVIAISPKVKKLLSLIAPVTSVAFTKAKPPTAQQLSMLYNRFSAVAVTIYLEPSSAGVKYSLGKARRYVKFEEADDETRRACIRGLMHLAILLRHLHLPLQDIWDWLAHMSNVLVDEYMQTHGARIATGIQMLLGCVRRVIETPLMDPGQTVSEYPDPAWLTGRQWIPVRSSETPTNLFPQHGSNGSFPSILSSAPTR